MNEEKQIIIIGKMKSCKNGFHTGDEVFDRGGLCRTILASDHKHPICVLEVEDAENNCGYEGPIPQRGGALLRS